MSDKRSSGADRAPVSLSSGSTATVCVIRNGAELAVAHVGDSRALLCRKAAARQLTNDHEPELTSEQERIEQCGGRITWSSVGRPRVNGVLEMTRSIGDIELKKCGVIAEPDVHSLEVSVMCACLAAFSGCSFYFFLFNFYHVPLCISTVFVVARCPSVRLSVMFGHSIQVAGYIVRLLCWPVAPSF